ncbi:MAG: queuosine precursor transporter [Planctomycetota bacterium]
MSGYAAPLPSQQHRYDGLDPLTEAALHRRRETVFLVFAGIFLGLLAMLNILGISRFLVIASWSAEGGLSWGQWGELSFAVAVGVLPYPLTFLCTDIISELFGRARANAVVLVGFLINLLVVGVLWLGGVLPETVEMVSYGVDTLGREVMGPPLPEPVYNDGGAFLRFNEAWTFYRVRELAFGAVAASMTAYLAAQLIDVQVFHFWKRLTKGKHLWLRNNGSTIVSQFVDTTAVILITHFYARALSIDPEQGVWIQLMVYIATGYAFKLLCAMVDTVPFYIAAGLLRRYLRLPPATHGHEPS